MRKLYYAASIGVVLALASAITYLLVTQGKAANSLPSYATLLLEAFKTLLTFSLVTVGGLVIKGLVDQLLDDARDRRTEASRYEETPQYT